MEDQAIQGFRGQLISPGDSAYDEARALYNGMIDRRPALIARCTNAADVIAAVNFARDRQLLLAIRGGGHSGSGLGSCDDGLVIDLSQLRSVRVDPLACTVRADPGCTSADLDHATHPFGLAVPMGIVGSTGIAGLTLGGGTGYLTRRHGLTIDNLIEVDMVLADGSFVTADAAHHPELFWAVRGGGGNFGVVTSFLFRAHPVRSAFGGPIFWDIKHAREVLRAYRDYIGQAPEELGLFAGLKTVPPADPFPIEHRNKRACALIGAFSGPADSGQKLMNSLLESLPAPLFNWMGEMPWPAINSMFDGFLPKGLQWYWKGDFVATLPDDAIDVHVAHASRAPTPACFMHLYPIDGAAHRVPKDSTPWNARDSAWSMAIVGVSPDPADAPALRSWGRAYWDAVHPYNQPAGYINFMDSDEPAGRVRQGYGRHYSRLASIKAAYDPENLFRVNQNIVPGDGSV